MRKTSHVQAVHEHEIQTEEVALPDTGGEIIAETIDREQILMDVYRQTLCGVGPIACVLLDRFDAQQHNCSNGSATRFMSYGI
jgi:hypothetical protein